MSSALYVPVTETLKELKGLLKSSSVMIQPRIKMLVLMKKAGEVGISKRALMEDIGASSQSIHNWRTSYKNGGMEALVYNGRIGKAGKPSIFNFDEHTKMEQKLKDPKNGLAGYVELQQWVAQEFQKEVKYNTLLKYAVKNFGSKVKVARKSHVKKDDEAVATFKKTSRTK